MSTAQLEHMQMCESWESFSYPVPGKPYVVTHGYQDKGKYMFEFECNCPAFKFKKGECKHIKEHKSKACLWHQQFDEAQGKLGECPRCHGKALAVVVAV